MVEWPEEYTEDKSKIFKFKKIILNGRSYGEVREYKKGRTPDGKKIRIFFMSRIEGEICQKRNAWGLDKVMSEVFKTFAVTHIGVLVTRHMGRSIRNKKWLDQIWIMKIETYWSLRTPGHDWDCTQEEMVPVVKSEFRIKQWALPLVCFASWKRELTVKEQRKRMEPRSTGTPKILPKD